MRYVCSLQFACLMFCLCLVPCGYGTYQKDFNAPECVPCDFGLLHCYSKCWLYWLWLVIYGVGSYASHTGQTICQSCQPSTYAPNVGAANCTVSYCWQLFLRWIYDCFCIFHKSYLWMIGSFGCRHAQLDRIRAATGSLNVEFVRMALMDALLDSRHGMCVVVFAYCLLAWLASTHLIMVFSSLLCAFASDSCAMGSFTNQTGLSFWCVSFPSGLWINWFLHLLRSLGGCVAINAILAPRRPQLVPPFATIVRLERTRKHMGW